MATRAYVACENGGYVAVIDARSHKLLSKIQLPTGAANGHRGLARRKRTLCLNRPRQRNSDHRHPKVNAQARGVDPIPVGNRAWGIALSPAGSKLYTANGASNDVSVVDVKSRKELRRIKVGDGPWGIAIVTVAK